MSIHTLTKISAMRTERGWSQDTLARMTGVSLRTIQRIEKGHTPSVETLKSLASVFGLTTYRELLPSENKEGTTWGATCLDAPQVGCPEDSASESRKPFVYGGKFKRYYAEGLEIRLILAALLISVWFTLFTPINVTELHKEGFTGALFLNVFLVVAIGLLLSSSARKAILRWRKQQCDQYALPAIGSLRKHQGIEAYDERFPVERNAFIIGAIKNNTQLLSHGYHLVKSHYVALGDYNSGLGTVMLNQCFYMLAWQYSGLVFLDQKDKYLADVVAQHMTYLGRENDVRFFKTSTLRNWGEDEWRRVEDEHWVVVSVADPNDENPCVDDIVKAFSHAKRNKTEIFGCARTIDKSSFVFLKDCHVNNHEDLSTLIKDECHLARLSVVFCIHDPELFLQRETSERLLSLFIHRYVLKINRVDVVKRVYEALGAGLGSHDLNPLDVVNYRYHVTYFFSGKAWEGVVPFYLCTKFKGGNLQTFRQRWLAMEQER